MHTHTIHTHTYMCAQLCLLSGDDYSRVRDRAHRVLFYLSGLHFHGIFNKIILRCVYACLEYIMMSNIYIICMGNVHEKLIFVMLGVKRKLGTLYGHLKLVNNILEYCTPTIFLTVITMYVYMYSIYV